MDDQEEIYKNGLIDANIYQAATLNKLIPVGYRIEAEEQAIRTAQWRKQAAITALNQLKKNESKSKKVII